MASQQQAEQKSDSSEFNDIAKLAPLTQSWLVALSRQYHSGKAMIDADWQLLKRAIGMSVVFALLLTAFFSVLLLLLNLTLGYVLYQLQLPLMLIGLALILLNIIGTVFCYQLAKAMTKHINLNTSIAILKGAKQHIDDGATNDQKA